MTKTHIQATIALISASFVLIVILAISPHTTNVATEASGEIHGIDVPALTKQTKDLPEQQYPAY